MSSEKGLVLWSYYILINFFNTYIYNENFAFYEIEDMLMLERTQAQKELEDLEEVKVFSLFYTLFRGQISYWKLYFLSTFIGKGIF